MRLSMFARLRALVLFCGLIFSPFYTTVQGQVILNEMMSSNTSTLRDQFNAYPDWIEVYNSGTGSVAMDNFWLSDRIDSLKKWNFPQMSLSSGSYLVVFASGNDISTGLSYWHTVINLGDYWKYLVPTEEIGNDWKSSPSASNGWESGKSGFGYGDEDDSTVIDKTISIYLQKEFTIESLDELADAALYMDYDDGFVAYLNGTEIARNNVLGDPGENLAFDDPAADNHEALMKDGYLPEPYFLSDMMELFQEGSNVLAVEVHNVSSTSSDMSAIPFLLVGYNAFQNDLISGNPYFNVKDTYAHTNFKIKSAGEAIYLSDDSGTIIDSISNILLPEDFSYGRIPASPNTYGYFADPTPAEENSQDFYTQYFTDSVEFVVEGESFDESQKLEILSANPGDQIYYTMDGSAPDRNSSLYTGALEFFNTTIIKARIFRENSLPGPVSSKTLLIGQAHDLPVFSVSMEPYDLWDWNNGIYVKGPNAAETEPFSGANFWQDWERPAHVELFSKEGQLLMSQGAGTKIFGGWSRAHAQKSQSFFARSKYGDGKFSYPLFSRKPMTQYEAFIIRNNGNDWCNGMFRDALTAYMSAEIGVAHQAYEPVIEYLNGEYWGIINMREKVNEHFLAGNYNVDPDIVNIMTGNSSLVNGNRTKWDKLYSFAEENSFAEQANYDSIQKMMDVDDYMRFWAINVYVDNKDWPGNNNKWWCTDAPGSKFRWISYDTDFGYSIWDHTAYQVNTLLFSFGETEPLTWANQTFATLLINNLVSNEEFRIKFINEFADRMNTTFLPENILPVIDSFQQRIYSEAQAHFDKWQAPGSWLSFGQWISSVDRMRTYMSERPYYMRQHLMDRFGISDTAWVDIDVSAAAGGEIKLNSMDLHAYPYKGLYFVGVPIRLEASPKPGYEFSHWEGPVESDSSIIYYDMHSEASIMAVFRASSDTLVTDIVINELNYESGPERKTEDWVELYNNTGTGVDLTGWTLIDGYTRESFAIPDNTIISKGAYLVFSRKQSDFKRFYPELEGVFGDLGFGLDSDGDGIALYDAAGEIHDYVIYDTLAPWPTGAHGTGATMELINPALDNLNAGSWATSYNLEGTPCAKNGVYIDTVPTIIPDTIIIDTIIIDTIIIDTVIVDTTTIDTTSINGFFGPDIFEEASVYPSPFSYQTTIRFTLPMDAHVRVSVFSASGRQMAILADHYHSPGVHRINWIPEKTLRSGIYFIRLQTGYTVQVLKVIYSE